MCVCSVGLCLVLVGSTKSGLDMLEPLGGDSAKTDTRCQSMLCTRTIVWLADGQSSYSVDLVDGVAVRAGSTRETDMEIRQIGGCYSVLYCTMRRPGQAHGSYSTHALSYLPLVRRPTCAMGNQCSSHSGFANVAVFRRELATREPGADPSETSSGQRI